jgi:KDO2-lipid IV(A) lauroyltransferase
MRFLSFIFAYGLLWLLHLLPERVLFLFSDFLYLIIYYVAGYRKKVVYDNLRRAFPELSNLEIRGIAKKFYRHLSDLILESAVSHFDSDKQYLNRISYTNPELLNALYDKGKQVIGVTAHYGNWEFLISMGAITGFSVLGAYKPLKNRYFDRMIKKSRERFNTLPVPMEMIVRAMILHHRDGIPAISIFVADQRPVFEHIQYWTKFLGQDTPLYLGAEKLARKLDAAVVFLKIRKAERCRYQVEAELICEEPGKLEPFGITEAHVRILERLIREAPEYWLWSHRRWKHSYESYLREKESRKASAGT